MIKSNLSLLLVATLFALALPALAEEAPSPVSRLASPNCQDSTSAFSGIEGPEIVPTFGGGGQTCKSILPDGSPNPDWPECNSNDGGTLPSPSCTGHGSCYCFCRWNHRCDLDPAECNPLSQCLTGCDAQYPGCPYPGGTFPSSPLECL